MPSSQYVRRPPSETLRPPSNFPSSTAPRPVLWLRDSQCTHPEERSRILAVLHSLAPQGASLEVTANCTRSVSTSADLSVASHVCLWSHCLHIQNFNHFYTSFTLFFYHLFRTFPPVRFLVFLLVHRIRSNFLGSGLRCALQHGGGTACSK